MGFLWDLPIQNGDFLAKFPSNPMVNVAQHDVLAEALHSACFSPKGEQAHGDSGDPRSSHGAMFGLMVSKG